MGYAARVNPRSTDGGKPQAFASLHRLWRAVDFFQGDRQQFDDWLDSKDASPATRAAMNKLWSERYPAPQVTLS